jgi:hypothetical protein
LAELFEDRIGRHLRDKDTTFVRLLFAYNSAQISAQRFGQTVP